MLWLYEPYSARFRRGDFKSVIHHTKHLVRDGQMENETNLATFGTPPQHTFSFETQKLVSFYTLKYCTLEQMIVANICLRDMKRNHDNLDLVLSSGTIAVRQHVQLEAHILISSLTIDTIIPEDDSRISARTSVFSSSTSSVLGTG